MRHRTFIPTQGMRWAWRHWRHAGPGEHSLSVPHSNLDGEALSALAPVEIAVGPTEAEHAKVRDLHRPGSSPVVARGAARDWQATKEWTLDTLAERFGGHQVPTNERTAAGEIVAIALSECVSRTRNGAAGYARFSPLMLEHPELASELDVHALMRMSGAPARRTLFQMFIGGAGTTTETHCAVGNNAFVQVHGTKVWRFVAPQFSAALDPLPLGRPYFASQATLHDPALSTHPHVPIFTVELQPGDVLLVPPFWWHQVDNPTESIGVACRWHDPRQALAQSAFLTLMTLTSTNPNVIAANRDRRRFGFVYQDTIDHAKQVMA